MNKYIELKNKRQEETNAFTEKHVVWAFSNQQFKEGIKKTFNLDDENQEHIKQLCSIGCGGFMLKAEANMLDELLSRHSKEHEEMMSSDDEYALQALKYELANHEYSYTGDLEPTLESLGLTFEKIQNDKRLQKLLKQATKAAN